MTKENRVLEQLIHFIDEHQLNIGERLPSERDLAERLQVSRNTLRSAIKILQTRGVLQSRRGAGLFITSRGLSCGHLTYDQHLSQYEDLANQLEARYLYEPATVALAAKRISPAAIVKLESILVNFSKALLANDSQSISQTYVEFKNLIFCSTGNNTLINMGNQLMGNYKVTSQLFLDVPQEAKNELFACMVRLQQAIKSGDSVQAETCDKALIRFVSQLLNQFENVPIPESILNDLK
jgi:GntR family transcriptional regulator, transcriptional repressor for pyruvate dehydrogenase complex